MDKKRQYILGDRPFKRYIRGQVMLIGQGSITIASDVDVIDTKGIKQRKDYKVIYNG